MEIVTIETPQLGDRSYVVGDGGHALVVDPQRDIDPVMEAAAARGWRITAVVETHLHNDYLSGGLALARLTGATYGVSADEAVAFAAERCALADGDSFDVGELVVRVISTPGHTPNHLSYVVSHRDPTGSVTLAVFSGGSLLFGSAGRTDLAGPGLADVLARAQWASIRHLVNALPNSATVHPTHGFGSFCGAPASETVTTSTIGRERSANPALLLGELEFVDDLRARLVAYPRYYSHMAPRNRCGVAPPDLDDSRPATLAELGERARRGEWVVDVRARRDFAAQHLRGSVNAELGDQLATYLGWVFPWGSPLSLLADDVLQLRAARRHLARIGLDDVAAEGIATPQELSRPGWSASYPVATFADLDAATGRGQPPLLLDVRHDHEWSAAHRAGAIHLPVQDVEGARSVLPQGQTVWAHCAAGYRAALACSLLARHGFDVVLVDDRWRQELAVHAA